MSGVRNAFHPKDDACGKHEAAFSRLAVAVCIFAAKDGAKKVCRDVPLMRTC